MKHARQIAALCCMVLYARAAVATDMKTPTYKNPKAPLEQRLTDLVGRLTLDEKVRLVSGKDSMDTLDIPRLGIPSLKMTDGPHGVRWKKASCFPTGIAMAATWNPPLIQRLGVALAEETRGRGRNVLLGPCVNISRTPLNGRNFEAFGEDPHLVSEMAVAYVDGVQSRGVGTSTKHYIVNNQEKDRFQVSVEVSERALREIYMPAFKAAVQEGGTWTVMTGHNKVNGTYCSAHDYLQNQVLKKEWGFNGLTVSDWGGVHDTVAAANGGQDLEMPGPPNLFGDRLKQAVENGQVSEEVVNEKVRRILRVAFLMGLFDGTYANDKGALNTPEHRALAREVAREAITLVKNDRNVLPLKENQIRTLAVIGPNAADARRGGGGSSAVGPFYLVSPLDGIKERCGDRVKIRFALGCPMPGETQPIPASSLVPPEGSKGKRGLLGEYFNNREMAGEPVFTRIDEQVDFNWKDGSPGGGIGDNNFSIRWTGKLVVPEDGEYDLGVYSDDGSRLYLDGKLVVDNWREQPPTGENVRMRLEKGDVHDVRVEYYEAGGGALMRLGWTIPDEGIQEAAKLAAACDAAVVCIGLAEPFEGEDRDRANMDLPGAQAELAQAIAEANTNTAVIYIGGSPSVMAPWIDTAPAVLNAWYPGEEGGHAIAEVLFGDINPSGKMPVTFPKKLEDSPAYANYPGDGNTIRYEEDLYVGYRYFDTRAVEPQIPFGHGLSYTTFEYGKLRIEGDKLKVSVDIRNTGPRAGKEVVQLYVRDIEASLDRPDKELKAFRKIALEPGEKKTVRFQLDEEDLSFYDPEARRWVAEPGEFEILVGSSSRDIRQKGRFVYRRAND